MSYGGSERRGVFVTGTDTGVGKTFVAAALVGALRRLGVDVGVMKPVASGCIRRGAELVCEDAELLRAAAGSRDPAGAVCPIRFAAPLGPSVAARLERRRVDLRRVGTELRRLRAAHNFMVVEGVGGLAVPLGRRSDVADMASATGLPLVIVAADRLGVLNHALLTVEYAGRKGLDVAGVILNRPDRRRDASQAGNADELRRLGVPLLARLGFCSSRASATRRLAGVARRLAP
jgi:dethiobiotin synthetase